MKKILNQLVGVSLLTAYTACTKSDDRAVNNDATVTTDSDAATRGAGTTNMDTSRTATDTTRTTTGTVDTRDSARGTLPDTHIGGTTGNTVDNTTTRSTTGTAGSPSGARGDAAVGATGSATGTSPISPKANDAQGRSTAE